MTDTILLGPTPSQEGGHDIRFEPCRKRVRVEFNGAWVADSSHATILHETRASPMYYTPLEDVRMDDLEKTQILTHCPFNGNASHWTLIGLPRETQALRDVRLRLRVIALVLYCARPMNSREAHGRCWHQ